MTKLFVGSSIKEVEEKFEEVLSAVAQDQDFKAHRWPNPFIQTETDHTVFILVDKLPDYRLNKYDLVEGAISAEDAENMMHEKSGSKTA